MLADAEAPSGGVPVGERSEARRSASPKAVKLLKGAQLSPSVLTSSFPRSWPSFSIEITVPSSKGPKVLPLLRRTRNRVTAGSLGGFGESSEKLSVSSPSAPEGDPGGGGPGEVGGSLKLTSPKI